ncbi:hypothetical protein [Acidaminococcus massiliensis]|jgi:uncharacterized protein (DUF697 family)|uniref:hypothetical protein n=1 Tax=Acidaminococcus massiliensis TaxID=1852375 RepID=UPI00094E05D9|nr:hypothetical protein [Acidaminococcus massiliensis]
MTEEMDKRDAVEKDEETIEAEARPMDGAVDEEENLGPEDIARESERIIRWGAARASVIVMTPFLGSLALMANEVYMITRLCDLRGVELETGAIAGLIGSLGASFVGQTVFTFIPFPPLQVPMAVGITYAVGKAANAWLDAGRPDDLSQFKEMYEQARKEGMERFREFTKDKNKNLPLGDERKKVAEKARPLFDKLKGKADEAADRLGEVAENMGTYVEDFNVLVAPFKEAVSRWVNAQTFEQLRRGELVIPYTDLAKGLGEAMKDSEFQFRECRYQGENQLEVTVDHEKYGSLTADVEIEALALNNTASYARFRIHDFSIADNRLGELLVRLLGTRIIMSLVNAIFNMTVVNRDDLICTFNDQSLTVDFTEVIKKSRLSQLKVKGFNLFDLVRLTGLVPEADGLHVLSQWGLKK